MHFHITVPIIVFTIDESQEVADQFLQAVPVFCLEPIRLQILSAHQAHLRLLEREHQKQAPLDKGLSEATMQLVLDSLKEGGDYMT